MDLRTYYGKVRDAEATLAELAAKLRGQLPFAIENLRSLSAGLRVRDTLLPLLVLPVLAPVLLAGSKAWQAALDGSSSSGAGWLRILIPFAVIYLVIGIVLYGPLQEAA